MRTLDLAIIEMEDPTTLDPVIVDLFQFSAARPLINYSDPDRPENGKVVGAQIILASGATLNVRQSVADVYQLLQSAAAQIAGMGEPPTPSSDTPGTAPGRAAVGSGRMEKQQEANRLAEESEQSTPPDEPSGSDAPSTPPPAES